MFRNQIKYFSMDTSKPVIVSFSSKGREDYNAGLLKLIDSTIEAGYAGDYMLYSLDGSVAEHRGIQIKLGKGMMPQPELFRCKSHQEVPYQFKLAMIQLAKEAGYTKIIWMDTSGKMARDFSPLLDKAKKQGVVVFDNLGHPLWKWISDIACSQLKLNTNELKLVPQIIAGISLWDFTNEMGQLIFKEWLRYSLDGLSFQTNSSIREGFRAHRHDQSILSVLCWRFGIAFEPYGTVVCPPHQETKEFGDNYYFYYKQ